MLEIIARDEVITREIWDRERAINFFQEIGEHYKAEIIGDLSIDEEISIYKQGEWLDLSAEDPTYHQLAGLQGFKFD